MRIPGRDSVFPQRGFEQLLTALILCFFTDIKTLRKPDHITSCILWDAYYYLFFYPSMILLSLLIFSFATAFFVQESGQSKSDDVIISTYQVEGVPSGMINK